MKLTLSGAQARQYIQHTFPQIPFIQRTHNKKYG